VFDYSMTKKRSTRATGFEAVVTALGKRAGVTLAPGWGRGNLVLKVGGKIFAMDIAGRLVVKLPKSRVDELVEEGGERFDPRKNGKVMKEWLVAADGADWVGLASEALAFGRNAKR
jgi:hypothetical protein